MFRFYYCILMNLFRAPYTIPRLAYMAAHPEKYSLEHRYDKVRHIVRLMKRTGRVHTKAYGTENLPKEGGYIMYANHQGKYDALGVFHTHEKPCSVLMDDARSHAPLTSQVVDLVEGKRMKKEDLRQSMRIIMEIAQEAAEGKRFLIFPEGGYFHNHNVVKDFKPGCFKSALKARVPIVPVALVDSYKVFEGFHPGRVITQVHYLPPIPYTEYKHMKTVEISDMVRQRIIEKVNEAQKAEPSLQ